MNGSFHRADLEKLPKETNLVEQGHILQDWFVFRDNRHFGPLSSQQVRSFLSKKLLSTEHFIWRPGFEDWTAIKEVEGFKSYGRSNFKACSDEEFSYKAKISHVDRIAQEAQNLDFTEGARPKTGEEADSDGKPGLIKGAFRGFKVYFGFGQAYVNYGRLMGTLITLVVAGSLFYNYRSPDYTNTLDILPARVKQEFTAIAGKMGSLRDPDFSLFEVTSKLGEPILVGATNLPLKTNLRIEIQGVQGSLIGTYRFKQKETMKLKGKIFQTNPLRQLSGKFIPAGSYVVKAYCLDCTASNQLIYNKEHLLGVTDAEAYKVGLKSFVESSREKIRLEIDELEDLSYTLFNQYKTTGDRFMQVTGSKKLTRWQNFSGQWLGKQNKLVELFQQIKKEEFQEGLYYLSLYEGYGKVVRQIFELHMMQDNALTSSGGAVGKEQALSAAVAKIDTNLKALKAQVELARLKFSQTEGVPEVQEINI